MSSGLFAGGDANASHYTFRLAGHPRESAGNEEVAIELLHVPDHRHVAGAFISGVSATLKGSAEPRVTAPILFMQEKPPGTYRMTVEPDRSGTWAIVVTANLNMARTVVQGVVDVDLEAQ